MLESIIRAQRHQHQVFRACVFMSQNRNSFPSEVQPPPSPRKYWTRRGIAEWLVEHLSEARPTLVGIDHGFSFPVRFFDEYRLPHEWPAFLDDFQKHWPTDHDIYVAFVREGVCGNAAARRGNASWRRVTEQRARAKSVIYQRADSFYSSPQNAAKFSQEARLLLVPAGWLKHVRGQVKATGLEPFGEFRPDACGSKNSNYPAIG
jgi:hypothetical protein